MNKISKTEIVRLVIFWGERITKNLILLVFTILLLVSMSDSYACNEDLKTLLSPTRNKYLFSEQIKNKRKIIKDIEDLFTSMNEDFLDGLHLPKPLTVNIKSKSANAGYLEIKNSLNLPLMLDRGHIVTGFEENIGIFSHEYGHAVFNENMLRKSKVYGDNLEVIKDFNKISKQLKEDISHSLKKKLKKNQQQLMTKFEVAELDSLFIGAYNELFADIIAVLKTGDLDTMWKAVNDGESLDSGIERSFSANNHLKSWNYPAPHILFGPVRSHLGSNHLKDVPKARKASIAKKVFDVIAKEINVTRELLIAQYRKDPTRIVFEYEVHPIEMNKRLIKALNTISF